jgi:peptidoglycan LD-endopeptidase CwlK
VNNQLGIQLRMAKGFRSNAEQAAEYAKGRNAPGGRTTGARPGESYHQYGLAADLAQLLPKGQVNYNPDWLAISNIAAAHGIDWGGWFNPPDKGHFEKSLGHSTQELRGFPSMISPPTVVWPTLPRQP